MPQKQSGWLTDELTAAILKSVWGAIPRSGLQVKHYKLFHRAAEPVPSEKNPDKSVEEAAPAFCNRPGKENLLAPVVARCDRLRPMEFTDWLLFQSP